MMVMDQDFVLSTKVAVYEIRAWRFKMFVVRN